MTIIFDNAAERVKDTANSGTSTLSYTNNGDFIGVSMFTNQSPTISSFTFNGKAFTAKAGGPFGGNFRFYTLPNADKGTFNMTLSYTGSCNLLGWVVASYRYSKTTGFPSAENAVQLRGSVNNWTETLSDTRAGTVAISLIANIRAITSGAAGTTVRIAGGDGTNYQLAIGDDLGFQANPHSLSFNTAVGANDVYDWMFTLAPARVSNMFMFMPN